MMGKRDQQMNILDDVDLYESRNAEQTEKRLNENYTRITHRNVHEYPAGTVVIIGQKLFRNERYTTHFYRTVLGYHSSYCESDVPHFVESQNDEWPDVPPWAHVTGHEEEPRDIGLSYTLKYWTNGEKAQQIERWIDKWFDALGRG